MFRQQVSRWLLGCFFMTASLPLAAMQVVATIPPLGAMVLPILPQTDELKVILKPGAEAHGYQLKPSDLIALNQADVILSMGTAVDRWADKAIAQSGKPVIRLNDLQGVEKRAFRHGKVKEVHIEDEHGHHHHHEISQDPHNWLLPANASALVKAFIAFKQKAGEAESKKDQAWLKQLAQLDRQIAKALESVQQVPFVVLHDAFQYFEANYGLTHAGTIQLSESVRPSIKHIMQLQAMMRDKQIRCVVKEPQFPAKQVDYVIRGLDGIQVVSIDPLGGRSGLEPYDVFLTKIATGFKQCLTVN